MKSSFLNLNWREALKGIILAIVGAIVLALKAAIYDGTGFPATLQEWKVLGLKGLAAGVLYIAVTFFSGKQSLFLKPAE